MIIGLLVTILIFACLSIFIVNVLKSKEKSTPEIEAAVSWNGSGTQSDPYIINNAKKLRALAVNVNDGESYEGVYFELANSINYERGNDYVPWFPGIGIQGCYNEYYEYYEQQMFKGHFNGNGHTISNFEIVAPNKSEIDYGSYMTRLSVCSVGFFACLSASATVTNLRLKDFSLRIDFEGDSMSGGTTPFLSFGGIAGKAIATTSRVQISNCSVENMQVYNGGSYNHKTFLGGIVGCSDQSVKISETITPISISNCYVKDVTVTGNSIYPMTTTNGSDISGAFIGEVNPNEASVNNCVLNTKGTHPAYFNNYPVGDPWAEGITKENLYTTAVDSYTLSSVGSAGGSSGTTWYSYHEYNDAVPYLRLFITWKTISFDAVNGTVSPSSIEIPNSATINTTFNSERVVVYGNTITGTPHTGFKYDSWTTNSTFSYTITFVQEGVLLNFYTVTNTTLSYSIDDGEFTEVSPPYSQHIIQEGGRIDIKYDTYSKSGSYKVCYFEFTNASGQSIVIKYESSVKYYISGQNLTTSTYINVYQDTENTGNIQVNVEKKSYSLVMS